MYQITLTMFEHQQNSRMVLTAGCKTHIYPSQPSPPALDHTMSIHTLPVQRHVQCPIPQSGWFAHVCGMGHVTGHCFCCSIAIGMLSRGFLSTSMAYMDRF